MSESLKVIPSVNWSSLSSLFHGKNDFIPRATIAMQIINIQNHPDYPVTAYAPGGDPQEGLVFIWKPTDKLMEVCIFPAKKDISILKQALVNTQIIHRNFIEILDQYVSFTEEALVAYLSSDKAKSYIIVNYPGVKLGSIGLENVDEIHEKTWPQSFSNSIDYFKTMISFDLAIGLFTEGSNELIGWIFTTIRGDLYALYVKESYRRKGYAQLLVKAMSKKLADYGVNDILAYIITDNSGIKSLFRKCEFQFKNYVNWYSTGKILDEELDVCNCECSIIE